MTSPPGCPLSDRQFEVVPLVVEGLERCEIAERMGITDATVRAHLQNIYDALALYPRNRVALAVLALRKGWIK